MFKVILLIKKRPELSAAAFMDYYTNHHVPLVHRLLPKGAAVHRRNFVVAGDADYDVISEVFYEDRATAEAAGRALAAPGVKEQIEADEDQFILRGSIRRFVVEVQESVFREL